MPDNETTIKTKDALIDMEGAFTGYKPTKRNVIWLLLALCAIAVFTIFGKAMGLESTRAGLMLGLILGTVILWVSNMFDVAFCILFFVACSFVTSLLTFREVQAALGASQFLMMLGMFIVAQGAEQTPIAKRVAFFFLYKFGKNQGLMLLAMFLASALLSVFCSNLASTVVMAAICIGIIRELEKVDPDSRFTIGKATMLIIPVGAMLGGMCLISSSPGMNVLGVTTLETATNGMVLEYSQWASIGIPTSLICAIPTWLIYKRRFKVPNTGAGVDATYFKQQLDALGPIGGSELRWIVIVFAMVALMIFGVTGGIASITLAVIAMCPFIGCLNSRKTFRSLPMSLFLMLGLSTTIATGFAKYGIAAWITTFVSPILSGMSPLALMYVCGLILATLNSVFANATFGIISISITVFAPIVMSLGMNPVIILVPAIFIGACTTVVGVQNNMYLTYEYGFWEMRDPIVPGICTNILWLSVTTVVAYFVGPMIGMNFYL